MATDGTQDSRARVQTYVPEYQKAEWERHADELDMSLSEFLRSMVQAGRRGFDLEAQATDSREPAKDRSSTSKPQGSDLEEQVRSALENDEYVSWTTLLETVTHDVETRLEETLQTLQENDEVRHSGRQDGYVLK